MIDDNHSIFEGMDKEEIEELKSLLKKETYQNFKTILREEDNDRDLFLIASGHVTVLKWDERSVFQFPLEKLSEGELFGDLSFIDASPRSSSIEASKETVVFRLSRTEFERRFPVGSTLYGKLFNNLAKITSQRLRRANIRHVTILSTSVSKFYEQLDTAKALFLTLLGFLVLKGFLPTLLPPVFQDVVFWGLLFGYTWYLTQYFFLSLKQEKLKTTLKETPFILIAGAFLVWFLPASEYSYFSLTPLQVLAYLAICFFSEFVSRGVLQTTLHDFLEKKSALKAILLTSLIVTLLSPHRESFLFLFLMNSLLGAIYFHQRNLIGVSVIHFVLGMLYYAKT